MNANSNSSQFDPFLARLQAVHPDGSKPAAPFIALTDHERRLYDGVGIMYAVVKCDQIIEVYKKPPVKRDFVAGDQTVEHPRSKCFGEVARVEYGRLIKHSQIKESYRNQAWHRYLIDNGLDLWRGVFTTRSLLKPQRIKFQEDYIDLECEQLDCLEEISEYLFLLHQKLVKSKASLETLDQWGRKHRNYKALSTLDAAGKYLQDFTHYIKQQKHYAKLSIDEWCDLDGDWEI